MMKIANKKLPALLAAALAFAALPALAQSLDYVVARDTPSWFKESFLDFGEDVSEAADEGKRVMIYFGQDGCPYCRKLHDLNFRQAEIVDKMRANLDSIAVNMFGDVDTVWVDGGDYTEKELAAKLGIQFTPTLLFLDEQGGEALRLAGYQPPPKFMAALDYVIEKKENEVPFAEYLRAALPPPGAAAAPARPPLFAAPPYALSAPAEPLAVLVTQRQCEACDEWRAFLLSDDAAPWREARRIVEIDLHGKEATLADGRSEADWAREAQVAFVPALVFLDADGGEEFRVDGYLRAFHLGSVLDYVVSGAYRSEPEFQRFLQARAEHLREQGVDVQIW